MSQVTRSQGRDLNHRSPDCEAGGGGRDFRFICVIHKLRLLHVWNILNYQKNPSTQRRLEMVSADQSTMFKSVMVFWAQLSIYVMWEASLLSQNGRKSSTGDPTSPSFRHKEAALEKFITTLQMGGRVAWRHREVCDMGRTDQRASGETVKDQRKCAGSAYNLPGDRDFISRQRFPRKPLLHPPGRTLVSVGFPCKVL
jgi:hypothetical protein